MKIQQAGICDLQGVPNIEGMLFVRIADILSRMLKAPLVAIGILLAMMPIQYSFGTLRAVDFIVYPDGTTHVSQEATADPQEPILSVKLFGSIIDNFVAQDENGLALSYEIREGEAIIQTFGITNVSIDYDSQDLISKTGKIWTFQINSPVPYTLTMPTDTVIVGMTNFPNLVETIDNRPHLSLPEGENQIDYFFGVSGPAQSASNSIENAQTIINQINDSGIQTPLATSKLGEAREAFDNRQYFDAERLALDAQQLALQEQQAAANNTNNQTSLFGSDTAIAAAIVAIGSAIAAVSFFIKKKRNTLKAVPLVESYTSDSDSEEITQEMREDDKELIAFLEQNGGQAFEKDLRKKFLLPRTTMWRAVKRLERQGVIEIEKKDYQNLVKIKKKEGVQ